MRGLIPRNVFGGLSVYTARNGNLSDEVNAHLLAKARERNRESLAELCEQFYPKLLKYMHYRVHSSVAEDLAGEVLVRVIRSIDRQTGSFVAWMYKIAANVVADHGRAGKVRREEPMSEHTLETQTAGGDVSADVGRQLDIQSALGKLTGDQRELVTLKFIQGLSNAEVGEVTGRKPEAVRGLQFRALNALRQILGGEDNE